jgi:phosphatidylethanolamine/phosphatidyl-N-methylethanolamine N-methyltransferase
MAEMARVCRPGGTVIVVNHFRSENRVLGFLEGLLTPASRWIGFRLDLPVASVVPTAGLELVTMRKVNLLGLWRLLEFRKSG